MHWALADWLPGDALDASGATEGTPEPGGGGPLSGRRSCFRPLPKLVAAMSAKVSACDEV